MLVKVVPGQMPGVQYFEVPTSDKDLARKIAFRRVLKRKEEPGELQAMTSMPDVIVVSEAEVCANDQNENEKDSKLFITLRRLGSSRRPWNTPHTRTR